jgi:hypothetical protein
LCQWCEESDGQPESHQRTEGQSTLSKQASAYGSSNQKTAIQEDNGACEESAYHNVGAQAPNQHRSKGYGRFEGLH